MIKILANDGIDSAGKKIFDAAGFSVSTDKVAQENLSEALKNRSEEHTSELQSL